MEIKMKCIRYLMLMLCGKKVNYHQNLLVLLVSANLRRLHLQIILALQVPINRAYEGNDV